MLVVGRLSAFAVIHLEGLALVGSGSTVFKQVITVHILRADKADQFLIDRLMVIPMTTIRKLNRYIGFLVQPIVRQLRRELR